MTLSSRRMDRGRLGGRRGAAPLATLLLCLAFFASLVPATVADPASPDPSGGSGPAIPSQGQVDRARAQAAGKAAAVSAISTRLLLADQRLEAAAVQAEEASEAYNGALWRLHQATMAYDAARSDASRARRTVDVQRDRIGALVAQSYQNGGDLSAVTAMLGADGPEGVLDQYAAFAGASSSLQADFQRFTATDSLARVFESEARHAKAQQARMTAAARRAQAEAASAAQAARTQQSVIAGEKAGLLQELARAQHISVALAGKRQAALAEIAQRRAQERARQAALAAARELAREQAQKAQEKAAQEKAAQEKAAQAAAAAQQAAESQSAGPAPQAPGEQPSSSSGAASAPGTAKPAPQPAPAPAPTSASAPTPAPTSAPAPAPAPVPAPGGGAQQAISFAKAQLGEPYQWGAAGPGSWDCSGLTMAAWGSAGRSLPHYSVAQYAAGTPITVADLQPGDLVFWSSNGQPSGIHHVALYLGGGQIIHAPRTGRPVEIDDMYYWIPPTLFVRV